MRRVLVWVSAVMVGVSVLVAVPVPGDAVVPGGNGRIVFESSRDGKPQIYVMDADGSNQTRLTNNSAWEEKPVWSPDGSKIAFQSSRDGNIEIYVMDADGSNQVNVTNHVSQDSDPAWSPDGTKIVFGSFRGVDYGLYVMDADGTNQVMVADITDEEDSIEEICPAWSPDGSKIAFTANSIIHDYATLYVMDADGSNQTVLPSTLADLGTCLEWSPDGMRFAFEASDGDYRDVFVMDVDGSNETNITDTATLSEYDPAWSPDGSKIVFGQSQVGGSDIFVMNVDGSDRTNLTNSEGYDYQPDWEATRQPPVITVGNYCDGVWVVVEGDDLTDWWLEVDDGDYVSLAELADLVGEFGPIRQHGASGAGSLDFALYDGDALVDELSDLDGTYVAPGGCGVDDPTWGDVSVNSTCTTVTITYDLVKPLDPWYGVAVGAPNGYSGSGYVAFSQSRSQFVFDINGLRDAFPLGDAWGGVLFGDYSLVMRHSSEGEPFDLPETLVTLTAVEPAYCSADTFVDDDGLWFEDDIEWLVAEGITQGCATDPARYCPTGTVLRSEMATFAVRGVGEEGNMPTYQGYFADVPEGEWYTPYVERAYELGITAGCDVDPLRYCPDGTVQRSEMAAFLVRLVEGDTGLGPYQGIFTDVPDGRWYTAYAERLYDLEITLGCGANPARYCPTGNVTRGQMAAFLHRSLE